MTLLKEAFNYGWIFVFAFLIINITLIIIFPKHYAKRLFTIPPFNSKLSMVTSVIYAVLFNGTFIFICFLPIRHGINLLVGLSIYIISLFGMIAALMSYANVRDNIPVTKGIYKYCRHPQQVISCIMILGIGISLFNPIVIISGIIQLPLLFPSMVAQEQYCVEKYGDLYLEYQKKTPRYFLFL